ncbi:snare associated Golgi protein-domain-containing protein [Cercophora newfieldiana]|uniref:Golgi apparatus membrane protein TVP38 n=1 Tax=Cercophora newfieldiana TaxID=92897 RepID=A0AA39Y8L4_9PEZI|nr:snare associated Golgi protein-domain-containing protein [Cercophora newfieldiana]
MSNKLLAATCDDDSARAQNEDPALELIRQTPDTPSQTTMKIPGRGKKSKDVVLEGETDYQPVNWKRLFLRPKYLICWLVLAVIIVLTVIITIRHDQVVERLLPFSKHVRALPAGWLIPIVILIIISFPPLFGHEVVALLCGVVYGLGVGFAIVAAGTFIGEIGTWFVFQYFLRKKCEKLERTNLNYGALARLARAGGFTISFIIRFSAIPSHFSTAVFSTCGVNFWAFAIATFLSLPKQIFLVYLGVLLITPKPDHTKNIVYAIAFMITICMAVYIWYKMRLIKRTLLEEQETRRQRRLAEIQVQGTTVTLKNTSPVTLTPEERQGRDDQWLLAGQPRGENSSDIADQEEGVESFRLREVRRSLGAEGDAPPRYEYEPEVPARAWTGKNPPEEMRYS